MRMLLAIALTLGFSALAAAPGTAAAKPDGVYKGSTAKKSSQAQKRKRKQPSASLYRYYDDPDQAIADDLDPARNFGAYPNWARKALSPKNGGGWR